MTGNRFLECMLLIWILFVLADSYINFVEIRSLKARVEFLEAVDDR